VGVLALVNPHSGISILNQKPIADAGTTQELTEGQLVTLYGDKSYDPDGKIDHYKWNQIPLPNDTKVR
jgi:hypothetical protein